MTRKRFVKLQMVRGWSRNEAAFLAALPDGLTYAEKYQKWYRRGRMPKVSELVNAVNRLADAVRGAVATTCEQLSEALAGVAAAMRQEASGPW